MNRQNVDKEFSASFPFRLCYLLAAVLVALPLSDTIIGLVPPRPGDVQWRVGAVGLVSGAMMLPLIGIFLALIVAHVHADVWLRRLLAAGCGLMGASALVTMVVFALDLLQIRPEIAPTNLRAYDLATAKGLITLLGEGVMFLSLSIVSFRHERAAARRTRELRRPQASSAPLAAPLNQ
jgi:hypothetical protein